MARNFPNWTDTHWDYEKGNLNEPAKNYTVEACRRVKARGGVIHTFVVGQVFEQENVDWLKEIAAEGHPIGNHTYDHVYLLAQNPDELQFRFQRAPWLIRGRNVADVIRENIPLTNIALKERIGVEANGFRTPGGFATGLHGREDLQQLLLSLGFNWVSCKYPAHAGIEDLHGTTRSALARGLRQHRGRPAGGPAVRVPHRPDRCADESDQRHRRVPQWPLATGIFSQGDSTWRWIGSSASAPCSTFSPIRPAWASSIRNFALSI